MKPGKRTEKVQNPRWKLRPQPRLEMGVGGKPGKESLRSQLQGASEAFYRGAGDGRRL